MTKSSCCGGPAKSEAACCVKDEKAKAAGASGCGCNTAIVIGAGPVGLAASAQLLERGITPIVLEGASDVAASVREWGHVRLFSPWRYNIDRAAARLLERTGWVSPPADQYPTGAELFHSYLKPLAEALRPYLHLDRRVLAVSRVGLDKTRTAGRDETPFLVHTEAEDFTADAVIDASGTWGTPNPLLASGLPTSPSKNIHYGIPDVLGKDRARYAGKTTLVVGAGHSAANSILALMELGAKIHWATRSDDLSRVFGGGENDQLPERGRLGAELASLASSGRIEVNKRFRIASLRETENGFEVSDGTKTLIGIDRIIVATGQRPNLEMTRELRVSIDPALESVTALAPLIDPNVHSCGTVRPHGAKELSHAEPNFFTVGAKSYGRAPTFLLATGYEQARSVAALLAGDIEASERVELELPETGVCSSSAASAAGGCC